MRKEIFEDMGLFQLGSKFSFWHLPYEDAARIFDNTLTRDIVVECFVSSKLSSKRSNHSSGK